MVIKLGTAENTDYCTVTLTLVGTGNVSYSFGEEHQTPTTALTGTVVLDHIVKYDWINLLIQDFNQNAYTYDDVVSNLSDFDSGATTCYYSDSGTQRWASHKVDCNYTLTLTITAN